jgi:hypothetical protein
MLRTAGRRTATGTSRRTATTTWASAWPQLRAWSGCSAGRNRPLSGPAREYVEANHHWPPGASSDREPSGRLPALHLGGEIEGRSDPRGKFPASIPTFGNDMRGRLYSKESPRTLRETALVASRPLLRCFSAPSGLQSWVLCVRCRVGVPYGCSLNEFKWRGWGYAEGEAGSLNAGPDTGVGLQHSQLLSSGGSRQQRLLGLHSNSVR